MKRKCHIVEVDAVEVLDSRGNPTVFSQVILSDGSRGGAMVPSGASTGQYEAHERRDGDPTRYGGKGVREVVETIRQDIAAELVGVSADCQQTVDGLLCRLDGTEDKHRLGANATLAVSLAFARARARRMGKPLWQAVQSEGVHTLPCPMMNVLNGGAHADNNLDIQEFMIVPIGLPDFAEAIRCGSEIYHALGKLLKGRGLSTAVGDEGGYAPSLESDEQALELLSEAIVKAGYNTDDVRISLDVAAGEWLQADGRYHLPKADAMLTREELSAKWAAWANEWPLLSIEDALGDDDQRGWQTLTEEIGGRLLLVGDDLFVTQESRLLAGIRQRIANAILIKPNQVGTLSETVATVKTARRSGYVPILSHRSGDTEDPAIADLAVALGAPLIKTGAPCRAERTAKYNRLLTIAHDLGRNVKFGGSLLKKEKEQ
ncbi:MAG: phosphopyruvate hydratase [Clostridia bacterium]|nr:phosphopyruvate hydratase [Clostridia bacterium]